jgi:hypothetical protein
MAAHLLSLPCELRNIVFAHLSHPLEFDWQWQLQKNTRVGDPAEAMCSTVQVRFAAAPDTGALLTHSRLHDEYLEESNFVVVDITMNLSQDSHLNLAELAKGKERSDKRAIAAFKNVRLATIYFEPGDYDGQSRNRVFTRNLIERFLIRFCALAAKLDTCA